MISAEMVKQVQEKFSQASARYDRLAFIQNEVRQELLGKIHLADGDWVLDVGCGTGILVNDLVSRALKAVVIGIDRAAGMLGRGQRRVGAGIFMQADAGALPFCSGAFDQVVSSSSYQWAPDLDAAFGEAYRVLKPVGKFRAVLFGRETFREMFDSFQVSSSGSKVPASLLPSQSDVSRALEVAGFQDVRVVSQNRVSVFRDLWSLLVWLKSIGANSPGIAVPVGKKMLAVAQAVYAARYSSEGGLRVTFEIIWIEATKA